MNKFQFLGRLSKDVETRWTSATNTQVAMFDIAVNRRRLEQNGERKADFFSLIAYGKIAEFCAKYFKKGQQVLVEGRMQNRTWEDKNGQKRYTTDYIIESCYFADSNKNTNTKEETAQPAIDEDDFITIDETEELPF